MLINRPAATSTCIIIYNKKNSKATIDKSMYIKHITIMISRRSFLSHQWALNPILARKHHHKHSTLRDQSFQSQNRPNNAVVNSRLTEAVLRTSCCSPCQPKTVRTIVYCAACASRDLVFVIGHNYIVWNTKQVGLGILNY